MGRASRDAGETSTEYPGGNGETRGTGGIKQARRQCTQLLKNGITPFFERGLFQPLFGVASTECSTRSTRSAHAKYSIASASGTWCACLEYPGVLLLEDSKHRNDTEHSRYSDCSECSGAGPHHLPFHKTKEADCVRLILSLTGAHCVGLYFGFFPLILQLF